MTVITDCRKLCRQMSRICGSIIISTMAGETLQRCIGISIIMTGTAFHSNMSTRQREICIRMIKCCRGPGCRAVAFIADCGKLCRHMSRICGSVIVITMTGKTLQRCIGISGIMTRTTFHSHVGTRQREICIRMIKCCR